ncbi:hypothetical protein BH10ACT11_BH10ACT11_02280 [soil metagenome]
MRFGRAAAATGLGIALIATGLAFDTPSLLVPGIALGLLVVVAGLWVGVASHLARIERAEIPARLREGEEFVLEISVNSPLPLPVAQLHEPLLPAPLELSLSRAGATRESVAFARRGRRTLEPARLEISDPLQLWSRSLRTREAAELLVVPRTFEVEVPHLAGQGRAGRGGRRATQAVSNAGRDAAAVDFEIDGVRSYREGTPASRIHWPSVARGGEVVERRLIAGSDSLPLLVLDAAAPIDEESLDRAVRAAASLCLAFCRNRGCAVLLPGARRSTELDQRLGRWPEVLQRLAVVASGVPTYGARTLARGRSVVWVSSGERAAAEYSLARCGAERGLVVTPRRPPEGGLAIAECWTSSSAAALETRPLEVAG